MDEKLKNQALIAFIAFGLGFMVWWWTMAAGFVGLLISLVIGAVLGAVAWFVTGMLS